MLVVHMRNCQPSNHMRDATAVDMFCPVCCCCSTTALKLVMTLRGLASGGRTVRASLGSWHNLLHLLLLVPDQASTFFLYGSSLLVHSYCHCAAAKYLLHIYLCSRNVQIIASIHQPSSRLYQQFDQLLLLSEGHALYYGDGFTSAQWFADLNVPVPFGVSTPDHLLDLASTPLGECGAWPVLEVGLGRPSSCEVEAVGCELYRLPI